MLAARGLKIAGVVSSLTTWLPVPQPDLMTRSWSSGIREAFMNVFCSPFPPQMDSEWKGRGGREGGRGSLKSRPCCLERKGGPTLCWEEAFPGSQWFPPKSSLDKGPAAPSAQPRPAARTHGPQTPKPRVEVTASHVTASSGVLDRIGAEDKCPREIPFEGLSCNV